MTQKHDKSTPVLRRDGLSPPKTSENTLDQELDIKLMATADDPVRTGDDPTKAVLSDSGLNKKHLCDYVVNVATGCRHGCKFCYVPSTPAIRTRPDMLKEHADVDSPQKEWGNYVLYRDDIVDRIDGILDRKQSWTETPRGLGIVGISFATDCYMDGRAGEITRQVVQALADHDRYARVLTRNPILALQDSDVFQAAGEHATIGSSISSLDAGQVGAIEPRAPTPEHRLRGLKEFNDLGVNTFVSMSPTYPTMTRSDMRAQLKRVADCDPDVIFHEPINPRGGNFEMTVRAAYEAGETALGESLDRLRTTENWMEYSLRQFVWMQELGRELDLPVHLWPDEKQINESEGEISEWLAVWKHRQSPEPFANRDTPSTAMPEIPESLRTTGQ